MKQAIFCVILIFSYRRKPEPRIVLQLIFLVTTLIKPCLLKVGVTCHLLFHLKVPQSLKNLTQFLQNVPYSIESVLRVRQTIPHKITIRKKSVFL